MDNLSWYSALNGALTYARDHGFELQSIDTHHVIFKSGLRMTHQQVKGCLHEQRRLDEVHQCTQR